MAHRECGRAARNGIEPSARGAVGRKHGVDAGDRASDRDADTLPAVVSARVRYPDRWPMMREAPARAACERNLGADASAYARA